MDMETSLDQGVVGNGGQVAVMNRSLLDRKGWHRAGIPQANAGEPSGKCFLVHALKAVMVVRQNPSRRVLKVPKSKSCAAISCGSHLSLCHFGFPLLFALRHGPSGTVIRECSPRDDSEPTRSCLICRQTCSTNCSCWSLYLGH